MKKTSRLFATLALSAFLFTGAAAALAAPQTICPVLGNSINKNIFADYKGKRVYFCCPPCVAQFKQNPEAYLQKLAEVGQEPEPVPSSK